MYRSYVKFAYSLRNLRRKFAMFGNSERFASKVDAAVLVKTFSTVGCLGRLRLLQVYGSQIIKRLTSLDKIWLEVMLCLIGEAFDDHSKYVSYNCRLIV